MEKSDKEITELAHKNKKVANKKIFTPSNSSKKQINNCPLCNSEVELKLYKLHLESHPSKILDWLYLGSYNNATNKKELEILNVKYVLNCAKECKNLFEKEYSYKHIILSDQSTENLTQHFEEAYEFIEKAKNNESVILVHCMMGKSRSSSFVIAYLMKKMNLNFESAYKLVKTARRMAFPNLGFIRQLREYEKNII